MIGSLLRWIIIWPVPPRYSGQAVGILLITVAVIAIANVHSFPGVLAAACGATLLVFTARAFKRLRRPA